MICGKHSNWSYNFIDNDEKLVIKQSNCEGTYSIRCIITKEMFLNMYNAWIKNDKSESEDKE